MPSPEVMGSGTLCPGGRLAWPQCPHALQASALCLQSCRSADLQTRAHCLMEGTDWKASLSSPPPAPPLPPSPLFIRFQALGASPSFPGPLPGHPASGQEGALAGPRKLDCRGQMAELRLQCVRQRPSGPALRPTCCCHSWTHALPPVPVVCAGAFRGACILCSH